MSPSKPTTEPTLSSLFAAPGIAKRLTEAQSILADLESQYRHAALDSVQGVDLGNNLAAIKLELAAAAASVADLTAAHQVALERDALEAARQRAAQHKSQINVCRSHLNIRDRAAEACSAALAEAIKQWRIMLEHSTKAKAAIPGWGIKPGAALEFGEIKRLVEHEIYRFGADPGLTGAYAFPGGKSPNVLMTHQPEKITPLAETIHEASDHFLDVLVGKVKE